MWDPESHLRCVVYEIDGSCGAYNTDGDEAAERARYRDPSPNYGTGTHDEAPKYVAPDLVKVDHFVLDYTDQNADLHIFHLTDAVFTKIRDISEGRNGIKALYTLNRFGSATNAAGDVLLYLNFITIRSTLVQQGPNDYRGRFVQSGPAGGFYWRPVY